MLDPIANNIKYLVRLSGLKQDDFGALFDLKRGNINSYISGKTKPKIETAIRIADHFNITIDDFIKKELNKSSVSSFEETAVPKQKNEPSSEVFDRLERYVAENALLKKEIEELKARLNDK